MARVAEKALQICHFHPATGADLRRGDRAREDCVAACYSCLMSYGNQTDHKLLDRQLVRDLLLQLRSCTLQISPAAAPRAAHLEHLKDMAGSGLERQWLDALEARGLRLPTSAQRKIEACATRPDFLYEAELAVVYVDGPPHDFPDRQARDQALTRAMEDQGFTVVRFHHAADWDAVFARYPHVFGRPVEHGEP